MWRTWSFSHSDWDQRDGFGLYEQLVRSPGGHPVPRFASSTSCTRRWHVAPLRTSWDRLTCPVGEPALAPKYAARYFPPGSDVERLSGARLRMAAGLNDPDVASMGSQNCACKVCRVAGFDVRDFEFAGGRHPAQIHQHNRTGCLSGDVLRLMLVEMNGVACGITRFMAWNRVRRANVGGTSVSAICNW